MNRRLFIPSVNTLLLFCPFLFHGCLPLGPYELSLTHFVLSIRTYLDIGQSLIQPYISSILSFRNTANSCRSHAPVLMVRPISPISPPLDLPSCHSRSLCRLHGNKEVMRADKLVTISMRRRRSGRPPFTDNIQKAMCPFNRFNPSPCRLRRDSYEHLFCRYFAFAHHLQITARRTR